MAATAYKAIDASGLSRVDFFLKKNGKLLVNELNTLPGLTDVSGFPTTARDHPVTGIFV